MNVIPRHLTSVVESCLSTSRVVNIVGPRQAGKTTLVRDLIKPAHYLTLDDESTLKMLEVDVYGQMQLLSERGRKAGLPVVIDEVQRLPELTMALKRIVDSENRKGQFLLTGSSDIFTSGQSYDSLAGRVMTLTLRSFSAAEITEHAPCGLLNLVADNHEDCLSNIPAPCSYVRSDAIELVLRGGFPEIRGLEDLQRIRRYLSYLDSIIERDVAPIASVRKPDVLRRLVDQLAVRTAGELNVASLCMDLGIRKETANEYIDVLSRLGIVHRLGAWTSSGGKREIRAPKLHFLDSGCAAALRGEDESSFGIAADPVALGQLLESFVFSELEKSLPYQTKRWRFYHWRHEAKEIDILAEAPGRLITLFEVKPSVTVVADDFRHINWFFKDGPGKSYRGTGFVFYLGADVLSFGKGRIALPLSTLWSFV